MADSCIEGPGAASPSPDQDALRTRAWDELWRILLSPRALDEDAPEHCPARSDRITLGNDPGASSAPNDVMGDGDA